MKNTKLQKYYPWIVVALLWVVALLNYMDRQMLSTMRESMQVDIAELEEAVNFGRRPTTWSDPLPGNGKGPAEQRQGLFSCSGVRSAVHGPSVDDDAGEVFAEQ